MKSFIVNKSISNFRWYFILFIIIHIVRHTSSAVLPPRNIVSLYTANDKITILTGQNFSSTVYQSKTAWLIEFYASWCGHCQSYANTYREVAIDTLGWKTIVRVGAINCYAEDNNAVCDQHNIMSYPTLRLIAPETPTNTSKIISLTANDSKDVERELIKELDALHRTDKSWPNFAPVNRASFDDLYTRAPPSVKLLLVIVEKRDDYTGRQIMLDFSKYYEQLTIFRATIDGRLWHKFHINMTDIPALFIIHPNRTTEQINTTQNKNENIGSRNLFNYAIRSYIHERKCIDHFNDRDLEEIILSKNALKNAEALKNSNQDNKEINDETEKNISQQKVNMLDMETALSYMLRREIPRMKQIQGQPYDALVHWLNVLVKYFPGREPVMNYLKQLVSEVNKQTIGLNGKQFRELTDRNTPNSYLPNNQAQYKYCTGSLPQYRGYPCALWLIFHTLTVSQVKSEPKRMNIIEVPSAIRNFLNHFFGCRHCSENFLKETNDMHLLDPKDKNAAVIYLWKIHNDVNQRLKGDETEDPKYPKIQFPSENLCSNCYSNKNLNISNTIDFLLRYYSKENIDFSSVDNFTISFENKEDIKPRHDRKPFIEQYSMIEINGKSKEKSGLIRFLTSVIRRFPLYFFISLLIIVFVVRRKYCKGKRKRYTL